MTVWIILLTIFGLGTMVGALTRAALRAGRRSQRAPLGRFRRQAAQRLGLGGEGA